MIRFFLRKGCARGWVLSQVWRVDRLCSLCGGRCEQSIGILGSRNVRDSYGARFWEFWRDRDRAESWVNMWLSLGVRAFDCSTSYGVGD